MDNREQYIQMVHNYEPMLDDLEKYNKSKAKKLRRKWDAMKLHGTDGKQIHLLYNKIYDNLSDEDKKKYIKG